MQQIERRDRISVVSFDDSSFSSPALLEKLIESKAIKPPPLWTNGGQFIRSNLRGLRATFLCFIKIINDLYEIRRAFLWTIIDISIFKYNRLENPKKLTFFSL